MFSKDITENDAFLDMPLSTQALYFHLGMQADDDGFVSPNRILRMLGCQADDLKILVAKKFVLQFEDGVVVIKHWKINNYLRNDRYKPTTHQDKLAQLITKENGGYKLDTIGIPVVDAGKDSIGKVRIGKDRDIYTFPPTIEQVQQYCSERKNGIDPEAFIAYYETRGWMLGKTKMKNWKSAVITWEKTRKKNEPQPSGDPLWDEVLEAFAKTDGTPPAVWMRVGKYGRFTKEEAEQLKKRIFAHYHTIIGD